MYVIVVEFDNTDPAVFGPYDTEAEAYAARKRLYASDFYKDDEDGSTSTTVQKVRKFA